MVESKGVFPLHPTLQNKGWRLCTEGTGAKWPHFKVIRGCSDCILQVITDHTEVAGCPPQKLINLLVGFIETHPQDHGGNNEKHGEFQHVVGNHMANRDHK